MLRVSIKYAMIAVTYQAFKGVFYSIYINLPDFTFFFIESESEWFNYLSIVCHTPYTVGGHPRSAGPAVTSATTTEHAVSIAVTCSTAGVGTVKICTLWFMTWKRAEKSSKVLRAVGNPLYHRQKRANCDDKMSSCHRSAQSGLDVDWSSLTIDFQW